jgi:UDP-N-acetylmuramate dehydrogenase
MKLHTQFDLTHHNTFGISAIAEKFIVLEERADIHQAHIDHGRPTHIIGWGSNVLIQSSTLPLVRHVWRDTIEIINTTDTDVTICVWAGLSRDALVRYTIAHWRRGIENLIAIPWSVGAAPVQNIGAYGVELCDVFLSCEAYNRTSSTRESHDHAFCSFGYRESIYKKAPDRYCIGSITLRLSTTPQPRIHYSALQDYLLQHSITEPTQNQIAESIETIRRSKLPRPSENGNTGSFFQNPVVTAITVTHLLEKNPAMPHFPVTHTTFKIPAARLIEHAGLKWYRDGNVWTYPLQPLVIVQYGWATGETIFAFSEKIIHTVQEKFGVKLTREVNIW